MVLSERPGHRKARMTGRGQELALTNCQGRVASCWADCTCGGWRWETPWTVAWSTGAEPIVRILGAPPLLPPKSPHLHAEQFGFSSVFCNSGKAGRKELGLGHENQTEHRDALPQSRALQRGYGICNWTRIQCH